MSGVKMNGIISIELPRETAEHILHCLTGSDETLKAIDAAAIIEFSVAVEYALEHDDSELEDELKELI